MPWTRRDASSWGTEGTSGLGLTTGSSASTALCTRAGPARGRARWVPHSTLPSASAGPRRPLSRSMRWCRRPAQVLRFACGSSTATTFSPSGISSSAFRYEWTGVTFCRVETALRLSCVTVPWHASSRTVPQLFTSRPACLQPARPSQTGKRSISPFWPFDGSRLEVVLAHGGQRTAAVLGHSSFSSEARQIRPGGSSGFCPAGTQDRQKRVARTTNSRIIPVTICTWPIPDRAGPAAGLSFRRRREASRV